jgi:hypothetical protein
MNEFFPPENRAVDEIMLKNTVESDRSHGTLVYVHCMLDT